MTTCWTCDPEYAFKLSWVSCPTLNNNNVFIMMLVVILYRICEISNILYAYICYLRWGYIGQEVHIEPDASCVPEEQSGPDVCCVPEEQSGPDSRPMIRNFNTGRLLGEGICYAYNAHNWYFSRHSTYLNIIYLNWSCENLKKSKREETIL